MKKVFKVRKGLVFKVGSEDGVSKTQTTFDGRRKQKRVLFGKEKKIEALREPAQVGYEI